MDSMERIFTVQTLSEYLNLKPVTIREMLKAGKIRASKIGKEWRITESAVKEFLAAHEQETPKKFTRK